MGRRCRPLSACASAGQATSLGPSSRSAPDPRGRTLPGGNVKLLKRLANARDDERQSANDQIVRKTHHAISGALKPEVPPRVSGFRIFRIVRPVVGFDNELASQADEIGEVRSDRRLPAETVTIEPMIAQRLPQHGSPAWARPAASTSFVGPSPRAKPCSGPISAISPRSRRPTARPCRSAASPRSSTSISSATSPTASFPRSRRRRSSTIS